MNQLRLIHFPQTQSEPPLPASTELEHDGAPTLFIPVIKYLRTVYIGFMKSSYVEH